MGDTLRISRSALAAIVAHAATTSDEICGLLLRPPGASTLDVVPCQNVARDPARTFEIDPAALIAAHRRARSGGSAIAGFYHSHPSGSVSPSVADAAAAAPDGMVWLIVADSEIAAWRAVADGALHGRFDPVTLLVADETRLRQSGGMTISPVDFASLLCSRLCHDLLSPIGALNNGLELLGDETDPAMRTRCIELLNESARVSASKLKFFRLAFGAAGGFGERVDVREARSAIEGLLGEGRKITLVWAVEETELPKPAIKVLLNLALIAGDALVRGGTLTIGAEDEAEATEIVLQAEGARVILDPGLRATLTDGAADDAVTPRAAGAYLVHALVSDAGGSVRVGEPADGTLLLGATLPARVPAG